MTGQIQEPAAVARVNPAPGMLCEIEPPEHGHVKTVLVFVLRAYEVCQFLQTKAEMVPYEEFTTVSFFSLGDSSFTNTFRRSMKFIQFNP